MLRLICGAWLCLSIGALGCGGGTDTGGTGGTIMLEPGPACIAFCAKAIGECEAFEGDEAACRQGCEANLAEGRDLSDACGAAIETWFECAAELDCRGVYDWRDREPIDSYPCRSIVQLIAAACPGLSPTS
ncbi:MAG: hypothetical protein WBM74_08905 [Polyangiales bacterium]